LKQRLIIYTVTGLHISEEVFIHKKTMCTAPSCLRPMRLIRNATLCCYRSVVKHMNRW